MFFNTSTPKSGKHSGSSRADINLGRGALNTRLRLGALARFTPVSITEELLKIDFTSSVHGSVAFDRPVRISALNAKGTVVAQYTLQNLDAIKEDSKAKISEIICQGRSGVVTAKVVAENLLSLTEKEPNAYWSTESMYPGSRKPIGEIRPCTPSLAEFLRDPRCLGSSYYSVRSQDTSEDKLTISMNSLERTMSFTLNMHDTAHGSHDEDRIQRFLIDCSAQQDGDAMNDPSDMLAAITWQAMEVFWKHGPQGVAQYVLGNSPVHTEDKTRATPWTVKDFSYHGRSRAGAYLAVEGSSHIAQLTLAQEPFSHPLNHAPASGSVHFVFTNDSAKGSAQAGIAGNNMQQQVNAAVTTLTNTSGENSLTEALTALTLSACSEAFMEPDVSFVLGTDVANQVAKLPNVKSGGLWRPSVQDLVHFAEGTRTLEFTLREDPSHFPSFPFNVMKVDKLNSSCYRLKLSNFLGASIEAQLTNLSTDLLFRIFRAFDEQDKDESPSDGRRKLQLILQHLSRRNPESWLLYTGSSSLPNVNDARGHRLFDSALTLIDSYLTMRMVREKSDFSKKTESFITSCGPGEVAIYLGEESHNHQLKIVLSNEMLKSVEVIPDGSSSRRMVLPREYRTTNKVHINTPEFTQFFESMLKYFFALVDKNSGAKGFRNSQLRSFLDNQL